MSEYNTANILGRLMYKIVFLLFLTFFSITLEAYSKKIILASFTTQEKADEMMATLPQRSPSLYKLSKKYNFDIKMKKSGKYHILVAEVFTDKNTLVVTLKDIKKRYKGAYATTAEVPKILKKQLKSNVENKRDKVVKEEKPVQPKALKIQEVEKVEKQRLIHFDDIDKIIPKNNVVVVEEKKVSFQVLVAQVFEKYFHLYYVIFFLIFLVVFYYYIKLKKIYNGY